MSEVKLKHWTGKQLIYFSEFIWSPDNYGWSLLALHSTSWGMKMFDMLKLKWKDILNEDMSLKEWMDYPKNKKSRPILTNTAITRSINKVIDLGGTIKLDEPIYVNHKDKPLSTSTLNREFNNLVKGFKREIDRTTNRTWNLKPIKSNTFEIAWALDQLNEFDFDSRMFGIVSRHMGHNSIADTIKLLEVEPREDDELFFVFNGHSFRKPLDFKEMEHDEIAEKFYSIPPSGTELWGQEHTGGYPL